MLLTGKVYDVLKQLAQVWLPAAGTLYFALAQIWHLPSAEEVSGTVLAVDTFLGVLLGISTNAYNSSDSRFTGVMRVEPGEDGDQLRMISVDPVKLLKQPEAVFKLVRSE